MSPETDLPTLSVDDKASAFPADAWPASIAAPPRFGRFAMCVATAGALALGVMGTVAYGVWFNHDQQAYAEAIAGARQALGVGAGVATGVSAGLPGAVSGAGAPVARLAGAAATPVAANAGSANAVHLADTTHLSDTTDLANTTRLSDTSHLANTSDPVPNVATQTPVAATPNDLDAEQGGQLASWSGAVTRPAVSNSADPADATQPATRAANATAYATANPTAPPSVRRSTAIANPPSPQLAAARSARDARAASPERHAADTRHKSLFARMGQFFRRVSYRQQHGNTSRQDPYSHP